MAAQLNRQIVVAARPAGHAQRSDFEIVTRPMPSVAKGQVGFRNVLISIDPYQRNLMGNANSELPPVELGQPMPGPTVAVVQQSDHPQFAEGDHVVTWSGWQQYGVSDGSDLRKIDASVAPLSTALGVLGHTGLTAWLGVTEFMTTRPGQTLVVTAAAGSVGSLAAQLGKQQGLRVVGIAGGAEKVRFLKHDLGLDDAVDYKAADVDSQLVRALPQGIDALLDNVGGRLFETLMPHFNHHAQVTIAGLIAQYTQVDEASGPNRLPALLKLFLYRFITIRSFAMPDYLSRYPAFLAEVAPQVASGAIRYNEAFVDGFEGIPDAFLTLFDRTQSNRGKLIARLD